MSKRGAGAQGSKDMGGFPEDDRDAPMDAPVKATAAQMAGRKILSAKSRRMPGSAMPSTPASSSQPPSSNPFGGISSATSGQQQSNSFGQQTNGGFSFGASTPSFGSGGNTTSTPGFGGFGSTATSQPPQTNIFGGMGGSGSFNFGGAPAASNPFSQISSASQPQPTPSFSFGSPAASSTPAFGGFGGLGQTNGTQPAASDDANMQTSPPTSPEKRDNASIPSIFGTMNGSTSTAPVNPFAALKSSTPALPTFSFGQTPTKTPDAPITEQAAETTSTPKPSFAFGQTPSYPPLNKDDSKPATSFAGFGAASQDKINAPAATSADKSATLFGASSISSAAPSTTANATAFKGFSFNAPTAPAEASTAAPTSLFTPKTATPAAAKPASNPFGTLPKSNEATKDSTSVSIFQSTTTPTAPSASTSKTETQNTEMDNVDPAYNMQVNLRSLNANFFTAVLDQHQTADLTDLMSAYISEAAKITSGAGAHVSTKRPHQDAEAHPAAKRGRIEDSTSVAEPVSSPSKSKTASLFQKILDSPSTPEKSTSNLFASTTPSGSPAKNVFSGFGAPAAQTNTATESAPSAPSNPFASLSKPDSTAGGVKAQSINLFPANPTSQDQTNQTTQPTQSTQSTPAIFNPFQVKNTTNTATTNSTSGFQVPKFGGGSTGTTNFMNAFAQQAKKDTDKMLAEAKAKRKAEEFDSDEDDEAEWERKDAEKQAAKQAEIDAAAKKTAKFVDGKMIFVDAAAETDSPKASTQVEKPTQSNGVSVFATSSKPTTTSDNPFAKFATAPIEVADDDDEETDGEATTPNATSTTPAPAPSFSFGGNQDSSPAQDKSWKPGTPIKFGSGPSFNFTSATPETNGAKPTMSLFGAKPNADDSTSTTSPSKTSGSVGFSFGGPAKLDAPASGSSFSFLSATNSAVNSRASSPGIPPSVAGSTDGQTESADGAAADGDAEAPLPQNDLTGLSEAEMREEDLLFEVEKARCMLYNKENTESPWENKGTGPLRVLKNKETGVVRLLARVTPSGKVTINTRLQKGIKYEFKGKGMVRFAVAAEGGRMDTWMVKMKEDSKATELEEVCEGNKGS